MAVKKTSPKRKTSKKKEYVCSTCGAVTASKGHLCTPVILDKAYSCDYCGTVVSNPRHICKPKRNYPIPVIYAAGLLRRRLNFASRRKYNIQG
jgi:DNA-directed RNA polymerase subunit RPC12/RpoP